MKITQSLKLLCSTGLALHAAVAGAEIIDQIFDYATNPGSGQWILWAKGATCDAGTATWDPVNENYVIETELTTTCKYIYYRISFPHALDGTAALQADIKVEATSGLIGDARVALGYGVDYPGFGAGGRAVSDYNYATATGGWQAIGGDYTNYLLQARARLQSTIALAEIAELLPKTPGPVVYMINNTVNVSGVTPRAVNLRVTVDNLHIQHDGRSYSALLADAATAGAAYSTRVDPILSALDSDIDSTRTSIDSLALGGRPDIDARLSAEAETYQDSHDAIVAAAAGRTDMTKLVPTQVQYDQDLINLSRLQRLLALGHYVAGGGNGLIHYSWDATGRDKLDDLSLGVQSEPAGTNQMVASLGEFEPLAVVLQNLNPADVAISAVTVGTLTNDHGETLPAGKLDVRLVKNWYTGNGGAIRVQPGDGKVRVPELLLKDDELVHVDAGTQSNALRISVGGVQSYQDVSSPTAMMPNGATTADAATLQPFTIPTLHARELWLTLDTRSDVRPGYYTGNVSIAYQIVGDSTPRTLQVPVELSVLPVQLASSALTYGIYYRGRIDATKAGLISEYKTQAQYVAELTNMLEHGVDHPTQYIGSSLTEVADYVTLRESIGLPCDKYFFLSGMGNIGTDATTAATNATSLLGVLESESACANAQLYMYGIDEATGAALDGELAAMQAVHDAGGKTFVAGYIGTYSHIHAGLDTLVFSGRPNDVEIGLWRADGKDVYSYGNPQVGVPDPHVYRTNYGLLLWQHDYTGAMDYAYQDGFPGKSGADRGDLAGCATSTTGYCSLWNDFDSSIYYDHVFTYPTSDGVIDTVQWEGFREGIDDTRYIATVEAALQASSDAGVIAGVEAMLATLKSDNGTISPGVARYYLQLSLSLLNQAPTLDNVQLFTGADSIAVIGEASDPEGFIAAIEVKLDNGAWQRVGNESPWQYQFNGVADGTHTVHFRVVDYWTASAEGQDDIDVDTQSPGCGE